MKKYYETPESEEINVQVENIIMYAGGIVEPIPGEEE